MLEDLMLAATSEKIKKVNISSLQLVTDGNKT